MTLTAAPVKSRPARPARLRQLPGLDGLRAIAVIAVIIYHLNPSWLRGGYLGVDVFFVISGYLITSLLLAEWSRSRRVALVAFWRRRARRLLPALAAVLVAVTLMASFAARDGLARLQGDLPASMFYVMNWRLLVHHDSYIASLGRPPLLQHLWSLSVEEQFYLLWPPVLILLRRRLTSGRLALVALSGAGVSALLMAVLFHSGGDPSGVYFGSETHAQGLLIGCALASAIPPWRMAATVPQGARRLLERSGLLGLAVVVAGLATLGFYSPATYRGGMLMVDLATAVVIATVAHPASRLGLALSRQPLRWAGQRSYSLYLWHWPIFEMTRPGIDVGATGWPVLLVRLALTAGAAEVSYRYIEQPWRTGAAQAAIRKWVANTQPSRVAGALSVPVVVVVAVLATAPGEISPPILLQGATVAARISPQNQRPPTSNEREALQSRGGGWSALRPAAPATSLATSLTTTAQPPPSPANPVAASEPILAVGDSVLLAASPALSAQFGSQITIDAAVGRQVSAGLQRLAEYRASGALAKYRTVMIDLGTNGAFAPAQFQQLVQLVAGVADVVIYDVHAARPWAATSNATISAGVAAHGSQMHLADWARAALDSSLLYPDGIHPDAAGSRVYSQLLMDSLSGQKG
jgi:peptidoglycan/LPS O-acetylase OafA/YrhL